MNAFTLLKNDHEKVAGILEKIDSTTERATKGREELFARHCDLAIGFLRVEMGHTRVKPEVIDQSGQTVSVISAGGRV